ncbi:MAG: OmpA family protein, partial [Nitrospirales bacterium]|nr:OmpA family protein [Nitrospirales bacterium]
KMQAKTAKRVLMFVLAVFSISLMVGCSGLEKRTANRSGYLYYPTALVAADRALAEARLAGKDRQCPTEFNAAKDMLDKAYEVYMACRTQEAIGMAQESMIRIKALCPGSPRVEAEPPLEPVPAIEAEGTYKYCVTLHLDFDIDKADIKPQFHDDIARVGDFMKKYPETTATIEGHTDNVASPEYNMALSQRRAESVVNYLADTFGIDRSRLRAQGYGLTRPIADNSTDEGKQQNRRIESIIACAFDVKEIKPPDRLCMSLQMEFDSGKADIKAQYHDEIAKLGEYMKKYPMTTATIEGHTDNVGGYDTNMRLSQQRAESVVDYLVKNFGIDRSRLRAKGYGSTRRIAYNNTPEGRQKNRRINAIVDCVLP